MYSRKTPDGKVHTFGTSGLLYRSNKLMFDRTTLTLWSNLTGEPVAGALADSNLKLRMLPVTVTTWIEWRTMHPETTVLKLMPELGKRYGYKYLPGAADRARTGVAFPVWLKSQALKAKEEVYVLRTDAAAKAYPVTMISSERVVNDRVGDRNVVLIADPQGGGIRAYLRGTHSFRAGLTAAELSDETGRQWKIEEDAIASSEEKFERFPGFVTLWFAWYGFFPNTEIYRK